MEERLVRIYQQEADKRFYAVDGHNTQMIQKGSDRMESIELQVITRMVKQGFSLAKTNVLNARMQAPHLGTLYRQLQFIRK